MRKSPVLYLALLFTLVASIVLAATLVKVENQRYALQAGMCRDATTSQVDVKCLGTVQTRTGWWWHLYYALSD